MAYFGKEYTLYKQERFEEWLKSNGLPDDKISGIANAKSSQKLVKNADGSYTNISTTNGVSKESVFKSGVEFDDTIGTDNTPTKSTITVDGNTVTHVIKTDQGSATFKKEYNGDELVVSITSDKFNGVAKRYYKA